MSEEQIPFEVLVQADFRIFAEKMHEEIEYPKLSFIQTIMAKHMEHGGDRIIVNAFRKATKTHMASLYNLYCLYKDHTDLIAVVSNKTLSASRTSEMVKDWISSVSWLGEDLKPKANESNKDNALCFDVSGKGVNRMPSFGSYSIKSGLAGNRGKRFLIDDIADDENVKTSAKREALRLKFTEITNLMIDDIQNPGNVLVLGTKHHEDSFIAYLVKEKGYKIISIPMLYPHPHEDEGDLAPELRERMESGNPLYAPGMPTNPERFTLAHCNRVRMELGEIEWAKQCMNRSNMSGIDIRPLKLSQLIVMDCERDKAPVHIDWGMTDRNGQSTKFNDIEIEGFGDDALYRPRSVSKGAWEDYTHTIGYLDPSGGSKKGDETVLSCLSHHGGRIYLKGQHAYIGDHNPENIRDIVLSLRDHGVSQLFVEQNNGGNAIANLIKPVIAHYSSSPNRPAIDGWYHREGWTCSVETRHATGQKETRIINSFRPVINNNRLIIDPSVFATSGIGSTLENQFYRQYTSLTAVSNCLRHDDRIDSAAGGIAELTEMLAISDEVLADERELEEDNRTRVTTTTTVLGGTQTVSYGDDEDEFDLWIDS